MLILVTPNRKRQINETAIDVTKKKKTKKEKKREETGTLSNVDNLEEEEEERKEELYHKLETGNVGREEERQQL